MTDPALRALAEALDIIDSVNDCHGCLDNGGQSQRDDVERLRALAAAEAAPEYDPEQAETLAVLEAALPHKFSAEAAPLDVAWQRSLLKYYGDTMPGYAAAAGLTPEEYALVMVDVKRARREYAALRSPDTETAGEAKGNDNG